jgi:hypothetical protein
MHSYRFKDFSEGMLVTYRAGPHIFEDAEIVRLIQPVGALRINCPARGYRYITPDQVTDITGGMDLTNPNITFRMSKGS